MDWRYEKRNLVFRLDLKSQYDRLAELAQLFQFRKKSAKFPTSMTPRSHAMQEKGKRTWLAREF